MDGLWVWLTPEQVAQPRSATVSVYRDAWWATNAEGKVAMWLRRPGGHEHPQCNADRRIVARKRSADDPFTGEPIQLPLAFANHRCD